MSLYDDIRDELPGVREYSRPDGAKYLAGVCPFHEDRKPSLLVFEDNYFQCQACSRRGLHLTLLNALRKGGSKLLPERVDWCVPPLPQSMSQLRSFVNLSHTVLNENEGLQWYLEKRGVANRIIPNRLGWYNGWYTIPVLSPDAETQGLVIRAGEHIQKASGLRFAFPSGQKPMLFVPDWRLFDSADHVYIVYGMFDALALSELRFPVCTTTGGKHTFDPAWVETYRAKRFTIVPDLEEEDTARELARGIGIRAKLKRLEYPEGMKDPADMLAGGRRVELENQLR